MELSLSLDAREVLFHLNYLGYRHITKEQLKSFMTDLKKLIKYESQPQKSTTEVNFQAGPHSVNIQRLFESHTATSMQKQREKHCLKECKKQIDKQQKEQPRIIRQKSASDIEKRPCTRNRDAPKKVNEANSQSNKENIPRNENNQARNQQNRLPTEKEPQKSKMWIRPKSAQSTRPVNSKKRTDPVALYQEYQKDWERFRNNICESSRSDLRWTIREKMLANH